MNPLQQDNSATLARLHDLDRAIANHAIWLARFNRQLICREAPSADDLAEDAHTRCRFGAWFYAAAQSDLADSTSLAAIESAHRSMHNIARHLLACQAAGEAVPGPDYDAFTAIATRFRQLLRRLEMDLMERLGAVDNLTGVWNRQAVNLRLAEEIERVEAHQVHPVPQPVIVVAAKFPRIVPDLKIAGHHQADLEVQVGPFARDRIPAG